MLSIAIRHFKFTVGNAHFIAVGSAGITDELTGKCSVYPPVFGLIDDQP